MSIQDKFNRANVIYKITKDIDLGGETLTIPEGCTLDFQGGNFSNGTIVGNNTKVFSSVSRIFDLSIELSGTWDVDNWYIEWFGHNGKEDIASYLEKLNHFNIRLLPKTYNLSTVVLGERTRLVGSGTGQTIINHANNTEGNCLIFENWFSGELADLTIDGQYANAEVEEGFQDALLKIRRTKGDDWEVSQVNTYYTSIHNIAVINSKFNGISILGQNDVDKGVTYAWCWGFQFSDIWVRFSNHYGIWNNSTDNRFMQMNVYSAYYADVYESGSSNIWVNLKLDGGRVSKGDIESAEEVLHLQDRGAQLILNTADGCVFNNLDIQTSGLTGVKVLNCQKLDLNCHINNSGYNESDTVERFKYCPAIYIDKLLYSSIKATCYWTSKQYRIIELNKQSDISLNSIQIINDSFHINSVDAERLSWLETDNIIKCPAKDFERYIKAPIILHNLNPYYSLEEPTGQSVAPTEWERENPIFGSRSARFRTAESGLNHLQFAPIKGKTKHIYLAVAVCQVNKMTTNKSTSERTATPYFNIIDKDSGTAVTSVYSSPFQTRLYPILGNRYIFGCLFTSNIDSVTNDDYNIQVRVYTQNVDGDFTIDNVCVYDLTQDIGLTNLMYTYTPTYIISELLKDYINCDKEFGDVLVLSNIKNTTSLYGSGSNLPNFVMTGTPYWLTDEKKLAINHQGTWKDVYGYNVDMPRIGTTEQIPTPTSGEVGFTYYNTSKESINVWNGVKYKEYKPATERNANIAKSKVIFKESHAGGFITSLLISIAETTSSIPILYYLAFNIVENSLNFTLHRIGGAKANEANFKLAYKWDESTRTIKIILVNTGKTNICYVKTLSCFMPNTVDLEPKDITDEEIASSVVLSEDNELST